ncbi:carotenoid oxygenase family protein [Pseudanabaena sp. PCC 6802]|uniref:carotenoid oxygenase family protein n=1 Tax=Pseudanabaena sp. PCC 6802 TaxID=118173 RepID=UPI00034B320B|nr:carotenoid oxygenase family protein [Pseudanabaena sp. PCC 6802]
MVQAVTPTFSKSDWQKGYESLRTENSYWIEHVDGAIPQNLVGTLFRNGPGLLDVNGQAYGHPFDGDGMVCAITLANGRAHFANSFVKTPEFLAEQEAGRILYRGVFGTQKPGGWLQNIFDLRFKNIANTNAIYHAKKLLALWEASRPYQLDPATLETIGIESFNGVLKTGQVFTAHPKLDPETGDLWGFGVESGPKSKISVYRIDPDGVLTEQFQQKVAGFCFLHDFAYTPNYRIFSQNPVEFQPLGFLFGMKTAGACLDLKPNTPTQILLFDRNGKLRTFTTDPCFIFHHCNAFEQDDAVILDSICYRDYPKLEPNTNYKEIDFERVIPGQLWRFHIDLRSGKVDRQLIVERSCEFPAINPRLVGKPYRYAYLGAIAQPPTTPGNAPLQAIVKVDLHTGQQELHSFAPRGFVGEPVFIPRPGAVAEDDGWLVSIVFDAASDRSDVVILDAQNITAPTVATLHLKHHVPYGLHGNFTPEIWSKA